MFYHRLLLKSMIITRKTFFVTGMHCDACINRIEKALAPLDPSVKVHLDPPTIDIDATISFDQAKNALASLDSYSISGGNDANPTHSLKVFLPLILIFFTLITICALGQLINGSWDMNLAMRHFMSGFFIIFSLFKFINLPGFVTFYRSYDLLAQYWPFYAWAYPFMELGLGVTYALGTESLFLHGFTFFLMLFSALGVYQALRTNRKIPCACLGTVIKLPMTRITLGEDLLMALMSLAMIKNS